MTCTLCNKNLAGGLDTFGPLASPDGLAPHQHAFDGLGNIIIGSTQFLPLPKKEGGGIRSGLGHVLARPVCAQLRYLDTEVIAWLALEVMTAIVICKERLL